MNCDVNQKESYMPIIENLTQYLKYTNMKQEFKNIIQMVQVDLWKNLKNKVYKQQKDELEEDQQTVMFAGGFQGYIECSIHISQILFGDQFIVKCLINQIQENDNQTLQTFITAFLELLFKFAQDDSYNFQQFLKQFHTLFSTLIHLSNYVTKHLITDQLLKNFDDLIQYQQSLAQFEDNMEQQQQILNKAIEVFDILSDQFQHDDMVKMQILHRVFQDKVSQIEFRSLDKKLQIMLEAGNSQDIVEIMRRYVMDEGLLQKFFVIFGEQYKQQIRKNGENHGVLGKLITQQDSFMKDLENSALAPMFLSFLIQVNQTILRSFNQSHEIALFLEQRLQNLSEEQVLQALSYSVDKDKLEYELRKLLIMRQIENAEFSKVKIQQEKQLCNFLQQSFGIAFVHKQNMILNEISENQAIDIKHETSQTLQLKIFPAATWINEIQNQVKTQIINPQLLSLTNGFNEGYKAKFKNRNIKILSNIGQVFLAFDKKYEISVNTYQATILLQFNQQSTINFNDLRDKLLQTDDDILLFQLNPIIENKILTLDSNQVLSVAQNYTQLKTDCNITSNQIVDFYRQKHLKGTSQQSLSDTQKNLQFTSDSHTIKYNHKEHKYRVQAFIMRQLKQHSQIKKNDLFKIVCEKFSQGSSGNAGIELIQENFDKCMEEIIEKEFAREDVGEIYTYIPG
eukprot:403338677